MSTRVRSGPGSYLSSMLTTTPRRDEVNSNKRLKVSEVTKLAPNEARSAADFAATASTSTSSTLGASTVDAHTETTKSSFVLRKLSLGRHRHTNDEIHSSIDVSCPVLTVLLDTPHFQRLRALKQLGTAEYVYMNVNHNRFEHSVGVAHLAQRLCRQIRERQPQLPCTEKDILCVKLAGLLHDIGHGPFSHTYEQFVTKSLPEYLRGFRKDKSDSLDAYFELQEHVPDNWTHEMLSLTMIDALLEYLGLEIDPHNLDEPLKQIGDGIDAQSMRVFGIVNSEKLDQEFILTSRDFIFIKECICGGPLPGNESLIGRPMMEKEWMYDIVNNRHSGLDVDKIDYYARDQRRAYRAAGEIEKVMIEEAVVAWGECTQPETCFRCQHNQLGKSKHLMICYPEKTIHSAVDFFKKRFELHSHIYQHKTSLAASHMICDIFCLADPYFRLLSIVNDPKTVSGKTKIPLDGLPISCAMLDHSIYLRLRDSVIDVIANTTDKNLREAQQLIERLNRRDLYKCAVNMKIDMNKEKAIFDLSNDEIKIGILNVHGEHGRENASSLKLKMDDFIVDKCQVHHGRKEKSPLRYMRFLGRNDLLQLHESVDHLPEAIQVDETRYLAILPQVWQENSIRIFCRDPTKIDLLRHVFSAWLGEMQEQCTRTPIAVAEVGNDAYQQQPPLLLTQDSDVEGDTDDFDEPALHAARYSNNRSQPQMPQITPQRGGMLRDRLYRNDV